MASKLIGIVGATGTGKSTSIKHLNSEETYIILKTISEKAPHIKNIIIEDSNYIMGFNLISKATENGFTKFTIMARDMVELLREARRLRDDLKVFYFSHPETIEDSGEIIGYKIKTAGKMIDNQIVLEGLLTVCLYTYVEENKDGSMSYSFITNRFKKYPAKSPDGMFEEVKIPNNLSYVCEKLDEYYN